MCVSNKLLQNEPIQNDRIKIDGYLLGELIHGLEKKFNVEDQLGYFQVQIEEFYGNKFE